VERAAGVPKPARPNGKTKGLAILATKATAGQAVAKAGARFVSKSDRDLTPSFILSVAINARTACASSG
jgi:hypothetical protein